MGNRNVPWYFLEFVMLGNGWMCVQRREEEGCQMSWMLEATQQPSEYLWTWQRTPALCRGSVIASSFSWGGSGRFSNCESWEIFKFWRGEKTPKHKWGTWQGSEWEVRPTLPVSGSCRSSDMPCVVSSVTNALNAKVPLWWRWALVTYFFILLLTQKVSTAAALTSIKAFTHRTVTSQRFLLCSLMLDLPPCTHVCVPAPVAA